MFLSYLPLLGLRVDRVLSAEGAVLFHLQTIRVVLLVLDRIVVSVKDTEDSGFGNHDVLTEMQVHLQIPFFDPVWRPNLQLRP